MFVLSSSLVALFTRSNASIAEEEAQDRRTSTNLLTDVFLLDQRNIQLSLFHQHRVRDLQLLYLPPKSSCWPSARDCLYSEFESPLCE